MMKTKQSSSSSNLTAVQTTQFFSPHVTATKYFKKIYKSEIITLGISKKTPGVFSHLSRKNTMAIVGVALGDEGKGRLVDNAIEQFLKDKKIKSVHVIRFQGGNNAGHTVEKGKIKLALHLIPSGVLHKKAINIIERGVVVHLEDLRTEMEYVEMHTGSLSKRLFLSQDALFCTDLERAEEILNRYRDENATGGTGRGIGPSYAHHYDKTGLKLREILNDSWEKKFGNYYDAYKKYFAGFGLNLEEQEVPDYKETLKQKNSITRTVGSKTTFLNRLRSARTWLIKKNIVINTYPLYQKIYADTSHAILFEGAQAAGLDAWVGTLPDVTASNTSIYGIREGTGFWRIQDVEKRIGVFKIPYTSSVGSRRMPTHIDIPKEEKTYSTDDQVWASWVRESAHEYGTTTGRPRDINFLDLAFLTYNMRMSGVEMLIGTHLDTSRKEDIIKVCTHYEDTKGIIVPYQPGLHYQKDIIPNYIELPGWDGEKCTKAKKRSDIPKRALQFLSFIQLQTGFPIIAATTGPDRKHIVYF